MKKINLILLLLILFVSSNSCKTKKSTAIQSHTIKPEKYQKMLGTGIDVNWAQFNKIIKKYTAKVPADFKKAGFNHVRIRVKGTAGKFILSHLNKIVDDCLKNNLIPIIAYTADDFKKQPDETNRDAVIQWWKTVSTYFKDKSPLLSFDIIIEVTDRLNRKPDKLNDLYEKVVREIRKTNPYRIIFISPVLRSAPEKLQFLTIPTTANGYLMAEWHFYASGPSKTNPKKLWTTGTNAEKQLIKNKIDTALNWQQKTGIYTWVGAWMPGNYNKGNDYSVEEQVSFAQFVTCQLKKAQIPFAINADIKFYDFDTYQWNSYRKKVLQAILQPDCK
jgi:hypothetical protein